MGEETTLESAELSTESGELSTHVFGKYVALVIDSDGQRALWSVDIGGDTTLESNQDEEAFEQTQNGLALGYKPIYFDHVGEGSPDKGNYLTYRASEKIGRGSKWREGKIDFDKAEEAAFSLAIFPNWIEVINPPSKHMTNLDIAVCMVTTLMTQMPDNSVIDPERVFFAANRMTELDHKAMKDTRVLEGEKIRDLLHNENDIEKKLWLGRLINLTHNALVTSSNNGAVV